MIHLDYGDRRPIYQQLIEKIENLIVRGIIEPNQQLPSVRTLAMELSINPNTIQRAYAELERQGYIYSIKGKGSFVTDTSKMKQFRQKEAMEKVLEAASEAARLGLAEEEILMAAKEGIQKAGCTDAGIGQKSFKQEDTGGNEHD